MKQGNTYFISDLHLGASYIHDRREHEAKIVDWLKSIEKDCGRLFLVGDVLDYWYEYKTVVPRGYVRFFGQLAQMSDSGIEITWIIGNHDIWISDYIPTELGIKVIDGSVTIELDGYKFFISHGDKEGYPTRSYRFLRALFRNKTCQFLYSAIHPGLTIPFAHGWSTHSRKGKMQADGMPKEYGVESVERWAREYYKTHSDLNYIILGHYHKIVDEKISEGCRLIILGDWINKFSYAVFDGKNLRISKID